MHCGDSAVTVLVSLTVCIPEAEGITQLLIDPCLFGKLQEAGTRIYQYIASFQYPVIKNEAGYLNRLQYCSLILQVI